MCKRFSVSTLHFGTIFGLLAVFAFSVSVAHSQTEIHIRGSDRLFPIAVPQLCIEQGSTEAARQIPEIMARNLDVSGYFEVLNPAVFIEAPGKCAGPDGLAYSDWSVIGAEGLVRGVVSSDRSGRIRVQMYLHDVPARRAVLGKEYEGDATQIRKIAHRFSNEVMKYFTGDYGVFGTQIAFSSKVGRFKELFMMDMDGSNLRQLTDEKGLALSSSWHPSGNSLVYTSYRNRLPDLFSIDLNTRRITQLTRSINLELGGKYNKAGTHLLTSLSVGRDSDIVLINQDGSINRKVTTTAGIIDVSPHWSPDNSQIVFVSNRAGGPQIYTMNADGSGAKRVSFVRSNYCTSPRWSPKGDRLVFVCRADGGFQLFAADTDGSNPLQLTSRGNNEDPDWSPDGNYIVFATTFGRGNISNLALIRADGSSLRQLTDSRLGDSQPTWGPRVD